VVVPRDGREAKLRRRATKARTKLRAARRRAARESALAIRRTEIGGGGSSDGGGGVGEGRGRGRGGGATAATAAATAVAAAEEALVRFRRGGQPPQPPGCAFVVFKDPLTARRALAALTPTWHGAAVSFLAWALPFRATWALGPGFSTDSGGIGGLSLVGRSSGGLSFGGGRQLSASHPNGGGGGGASGIATAAAARRAAAAATETVALRGDTRTSTEYVPIGTTASGDGGGRGVEGGVSLGHVCVDRSSLDGGHQLDASQPISGGGRGSGLITAASVFTPTPGPGGMPEATSLAVGAGVHRWRADHAPPPSGVLWDNVGVSASDRAARLLCINGGVTLGLVFVSSPLALFSFVNDVARTLNPEMDSWDEWVRWATGHGYLAGFIFQFLPNLLVVLMIYVLIPLVMERATRAEKHLTRSGALRSLVSKEFWYFLVNLLLLLAFGKAALSATVQQVRQCQWKVEAAEP
jgi:hypothetical protein